MREVSFDFLEIGVSGATNEGLFTFLKVVLVVLFYYLRKSVLYAV